MKKIIVTVFDKETGIYEFDSEVNVADDEIFSVKVLDDKNLEPLFQNDNEVEFEEFSGEVTRVRGFQPTEEQNQPKPKKKKTKKGE